MKNRMLLVGLVAALGLIASACQLDVERNADGSLQIEAIITEVQKLLLNSLQLEDPDRQNRVGGEHGG